MKRSPSVPHYVFEQCWGACGLDGPDLSAVLRRRTLPKLLGDDMPHPTVVSWYLGGTSAGTFKHSFLGKQPRSATSVTPFPERAKETSAGFLVVGLRSVRTGCRTQKTSYLVSLRGRGVNWERRLWRQLTTGKTGTAATDPGLVHI